VGHPRVGCLLGWGFGGRGSWGFGGRLYYVELHCVGLDCVDLDWVDLHRGQDLFQAGEDFVAVDVLYQSFLGGVGGDVEGELVAASILEDMEVLGVALAGAFAGDGFGGAEFEVAEHQLGVGRRIDRRLRYGRLFGAGRRSGGRGRGRGCRCAGSAVRTPV